MKHFFLLLYVFSLSSGVSGLFLGIFLYAKSRNKELLYYLSALMIWTLNNFSFILRLYVVSILGVRDSLFDLFHLILYYSTWAALSLCLPLLLFRFLKLKFRLSRKLFHAFALLFLAFPFPLANVNESRFPSYTNIATLAQVLLFYGILFNTAFLMKKGTLKIVNRDVGRLFTILFYLQIVFYPLMLIEKIPFLSESFPYGIGSYPLFYFICNSLWLYYVSRHLIFPEIVMNGFSDELDVFYGSYRLSRREKEICRPLIDGKSYREISRQLFISYETVKTHVNNIYEKAGVNNKMELSALIKKCRP